MDGTLVSRLRLIRPFGLAAALAFAALGGAAQADDGASVGPPAPSKTEAAAATARERERATPIGPAAVDRTERGEAVKPTENAGTGVSLMSMAAPLAVVLGVIILGAAVVKKLAARQGGLAGSIGAGGKAPSGILEVLGRYPIARGQSLVLLRVDRRVLLLSHITGLRGSSGGFQTLCEITDAEDVASILLKVNEAEGAGPAAKFEQMLKTYEGQLPEELSPPAGRSQRATREGDRLEMWSPEAEIKPFGQPLESADAGSLKARLASLRGRAVGDAS